MSDKSFPPGKSYVYAFSSGRLVLLVCLVLALMVFSLMLGIRIEKYQGTTIDVSARDSAIRPPVQLESEAAKDISELDTAATSATAPSELETAMPVPSESTAPGEVHGKPDASATTKAVPKEEAAANQAQKSIVSSGKPEPKATPTVQPAKASAPAPVPTKPKPAEQAARAPKAAPEAVTQAAVPKKSESSPIPPQKEASKGRFAVQVSSSQDKSMAVFQEEQLKKKGFTTYIEEIDVANKGRFYRVIVGPFPTEGVANAARGEIAKDSSFKECYVRSVP
jgi:cell division protein FtsN